jgi:hypothetical protein
MVLDKIQADFAAEFQAVCNCNRDCPPVSNTSTVLLLVHSGRGSEEGCDGVVPPLLSLLLLSPS